MMIKCFLCPKKVSVPKRYIQKKGFLTLCDGCAKREQDRALGLTYNGIKNGAYWKEEFRMKKCIYMDYKKALDFSKSDLSIKDLEKVFANIVIVSKKYRNLKLDILANALNQYSKKQFSSLIKRLKMIGEIYDPYLLSKKEGQFITLIGNGK